MPWLVAQTYAYETAAPAAMLACLLNCHSFLVLSSDQVRAFVFERFAVVLNSIDIAVLWRALSVLVKSGKTISTAAEAADLIDFKDKKSKSGYYVRKKYAVEHLQQSWRAWNDGLPTLPQGRRTDVTQHWRARVAQCFYTCDEGINNIHAYGHLDHLKRQNPELAQQLTAADDEERLSALKALLATAAPGEVEGWMDDALKEVDEHGCTFAGCRYGPSTGFLLEDAALSPYDGQVVCVAHAQILSSRTCE